MENSARKRYVVIGYAVALFVIVGFWCQTSNDLDVLSKYSRGYFAQALAVSAVLLILTFTAQRLLLPVPRTDAAQPTSPRLATRGLALCLILILLLASTEFVLTTIHRQELFTEKAERLDRLATFHPFLQVTAAAKDEEKNNNRWGFRGGEIEVAKPDGTVRVFVLGGSTVYCSRVDFEDTHCRLLELKLREAYPNQRIEVQNAGYDWHTSQHSLIKFLFKIQDFDPDLIVLMHAINDLSRSFTPPRFTMLGEFQSDYSHFEGPVTSMLKEYSVEPPPPRFLIWHHTQRMFEDHWFADFRVAPNVRRDEERRRIFPEGKSIKPSELPSLPTFGRNMAELTKAIQDKNIKLLIATQPSLYKPSMSNEELAALIFPMNVCRNEFDGPDLQSLMTAMNAFNNVTRQLARDREIAFVDLASEMPKSLDYFIDDVHYTVQGNQKVADVFFRAIQDNNLIEPNEKTQRR